MGEQRQEAESHAWTVDEMRKGSGSWSLASDAGMLQHLQEYSQKMISRTHDIQTQVTALLNEAKLTSVRVNNTFNDFIMLANTQFVENRVYDEDVTQEEATTEESTAKKEKTKEEREAELVPKVTMAMKLGLGVIESAFEKLDMNEANSDSEDEEVCYKGDALLEAKDPYLSRPLPYMIGSASFMQDDDVGLIDFPSEDEEEAPQEDESETETESESEEESLAPASQPRRKQSDSDEYSEGSDLFHGEDSEDDLETAVRPSARSRDSEEDEEATTDAPRDFASELAAKITAAPVAPPDSSKEKQGSPKKKKSKKQESKPPDGDGLFAPPTRSVGMIEEDEDSPFGHGGGLFSSSKGGGLFDEEDDLFSEVTAPPKQKQKPPTKVTQDSSSSEDEVEAPPSKPASKPKQKPMGGVSMFGGEDPDDLFAMPSKEPAPPQKLNSPPQSKQAPPTTRQSAGLFDNSDDDEEDFFAAVSKSAKVKDTLPNKPAEKALSKGLFDDDEGDLFADDSPPKPSAITAASQDVKNKPDKKLPAGAVSMFGGNKNPLLDALKSTQKPNVTDSEDDDMAWSDEDKKSSKSAASKSSASFKSANQMPSSKSANQISGSKPRSNSASSNSLFADEADDLFNSSTAKPSKKAATVPTVASNGPSSMFDEEEDDLFKVQTKQKTPVEKSLKQSGLFEESEEEVDIFATEPPPMTQQSSKKKPVGGVSLFGGADLFGDSLPKSPQADEDAKPVKAESLPPQQQQQKKVEPNKIDSVNKVTDKGVGPKKTSGFSLFDDENEEKDDIFAQVSTEKTAAKKPSAGLFADEAPPENKPPVEVKPKPAEKPVTSKPHLEPQKEVTKVVNGKHDLFNEDSDEDLFGDSNQPKQEEPIKPKKPAEKPALKTPMEAQKVQTVTGVTSTSSTTDRFDDSEEEEDLFGDSTKSNKMVAEPVKPKKPVGAVSMFGGMDPSALLGRKTTNTTKQQDSESPDTVSTHPTDPVGSLSTGSPTVQKKPPVTAPKVKGAGVQNIQSRLSINPSSLLPGAAPPIQEVTDAGVGFDDPPQSQTLHSVVKDRVKLRTGRRPPTRQGRKSRATESGPEFANNANEPPHNVLGADITDNTNSRVTLPKPEAGMHPQHRDEPSQDDINVFMGNRQSQESSITVKHQDAGTVNKKAALFDNEINEEEDIFGISTGNQRTAQEIVPDYTHSDDVIKVGAQDTTETNDVNTTQKVQSWLENSEPITKPSSKSVFEEGDEDIFDASKKPNQDSSKVLSHDAPAKSASQSSPSVRTERSTTVSSHHSTVSSKSSSKGKAVSKGDSVRDSPDLNPVKADFINDAPPRPTTPSKPVIENHDDDIFVETKKPGVKTKAVDQDDDLFTSSKLTSSRPKPAVMQDNDDDLFSSSKLTAPVKPKAKLDDDIFSTDVPATKKKVEQDDDIFADIMKPAEPPKPVKRVEEVDDIFEQGMGQAEAKKTKTKHAEVDDIFADISPQPLVQQQDPAEDVEAAVKPAAKKSTKKSKKAAVKDEDIFKDDTDIFANIPAAKPKQPKTKKSKAQPKPLFGGETDDIFADTSSVATKPKKTKKMQNSSAAATAAFEKDAPNIFDDPLNALDS